MPKLKLGAIEDDKPVKATLELPASVRRDLAFYSEILAAETGQPISDPVRLIAPMVARFMATDRSFLKARRAHHLARRGHEEPPKRQRPLSFIASE
ncbi:DUF2274 domain-containing protein [Bradyrhizobium japonicum]|uniref:DUF2274 domain-containing protein n=1 Tax=Bradyrhizobium japonicum TaxID=375 RepID=UPI001E459DBF|nr:DUF2274 domain-containing protein [Bradyrhizobium japonicum]MCD9824066.1 DUF2274 domain-containing protein [Bradyrhizobium japonicum]MCD9896620.1 DUF2274 domain-containing protein [Bradyrhizobium japonicum]MEB2671112.1 DUF2274 domain-containing protein [Bradyrhizobium japonicum]WLB28646.1 DUF2274 domain-containing protein [Bradyrhizobium japonicum]WRI90435.1 DUF2274 domain-containing protein [Bradyrhizobium japonicum]